MTRLFRPNCGQMLALITVLLALLTACATDPLVPRAEYLLRLDERAPAPQSARLPALKLSAVQLAGHIQGLVVTRSDGRVDSLAQSGFAAPLAEQIATSMIRAIEREGLARMAFRQDDPILCPEELRLRVLAFEILESPTNNPAAVIQIEALLQSEDGRVLAREQHKEVRPLGSSTPTLQDLIAALSEGLSATTGHLAKALAAALSNPEGTP